MTDDVKAVIMMQDGGVQNIMDEYPDLYVAGYTTAMDSVYTNDGASVAVRDNDHFLGTVAGDYVDAGKIGEMFAEKVIENGYHKVGTMIFPVYAYPEMAEKDAAFRSTIDSYNETVGEDEKIEVVGDAHVLEFSPLDESYFMEEDHSDLDCIAAFCDPGFVYSAMINARDMGLISDSTKLFAVGYLDDENFQADIGGEGTVQMIYTASPESITYCLAMIDNALNGLKYTDQDKYEEVDSPLYIIDSVEDIENVSTKSLLGVADFANCGVTVDQMKNVLLRFNENANGFLTARIEPDNNIIYMIIDHFNDRLHCENFLIYDVRRNIAYIHMNNNTAFFYNDYNNELLKQLDDFSDNENDIQNLWIRFYNTIAIKERVNYKCQINMLPLKYRKYLPELPIKKGIPPNNN